MLILLEIFLILLFLLIDFSGNEKNTFFNTMQLIGEIIVLILKSFYFLFESIVKKCLTKGEVSVEGKIVLVNNKMKRIKKKKVIVILYIQNNYF